MPAENVILVGATAQLTASAKDASGSTLQRTFTWSSSSTSIATVSATGLVTGVTAGPVTITAASEGAKSDVPMSIRVPITPPPASATSPSIQTVLGGTVTLTIPPGAVPAAVPMLTAAPAAAAPASTELLPNSAIDFGPAGTQFAKPVTISLKYDNAAVAAEDRAGLAIYLANNGAWEEVPGSTVDQTKQLVSADVTHFSTYAILRRATPTSIAVQTGNGQSATAGTNVAVAPSVVVKDQRSAPIAKQLVTFTVSSGGGSVTAASAVTNALGIASPGGWVLGPNAGANTMTAAVASKPGITVVFTATGTVAPVPAIGLSSATASFTGVALGAAPSPAVIDVTNTAGSTLTGLATGTITYGAGATGWLAATLSTTTAPATLTLTPSLAGLGAGTYTATVPVTSGVASNSPQNVSVTLTVTAAPATQMGIASLPTNAKTGIPFSPQPVVEIRNAAGAKVTGSTAPVTVSLASGTGTLSGNTTVNAVAGVATFVDLMIVGTGNHALKFTSPNLPDVTSSAFMVLPAMAGQISATPGLVNFNAPRGSSPAGATVNITNSGTGPLGSIAFQTVYTVGTAGWLTATLDSATAPTAIRFAVSSNALPMGTYRAIVVLTSPQSNSPFSVSVVLTIDPLPPVSIGMVAQPPELAVSGVNFATAPSVELLDVAVGRATQTTNAVTVAIASGTGTLVGTTTVNAVAGLATFPNLKINGVGPHTLIFTASGLTSVTSNSITVTQTPAALAVQTQPAGAVSGIVMTTQPVVRVLDNGGLVVLGNTSNVTAAIASGNGTLTGTLTVAAVGGVATFTNLKIAGSGAQTLTFTSAGLTAATSGSVTVTQNAVAMSILTQPAGAVTNTAFSTQPVVQITDDAGLVVVGNTTAVTAAVVTGTGTLGGTVTVSAVNGVATFTNLKIIGLGAHTLSFAATGLPTQTSSSFNVVAAPPTQVVITTQPAGAVSGNDLTTQPVVELRDGTGTLVNVNNPVTVAIGTGSGTLVGTKTVNAVGGVATFTNLRINGSGAHTLVFTSTGLTSATSGSFTVTQVVTTMAFRTAVSTTATSGQVFATQPVVEIRDAAGLAVQGNTAAVTASIGSGTGALSGTVTVNAVNGVATFTNLKIAGAGAHTLSFAATGLAALPSASITVTQTVASLAITAQPGGGVSGTVWATQPVVEVRDLAGLAVAGNTSNVTAAIATGTGGTLATTITVAAVNGVATFTDLKITTATPGAFTLTFSATGATSATSSSIGITGAPATQLGITTQPLGAVSGVNFTTQPVVEVRDASNLKVLGATTAVTAAITSGTGTLSGTTTVSASNGTATFTNLKIAGVGAHTITFTATALTSAVANPVTVTQVVAALVITTQPSGAQTAVAFTTQPVVELRDNANLLVATATTAVTVTRASGTGTLSGTTTVSAVGGVATFTNLMITGGAGVSHTLAFAATGATGASSNAFTVVSGPTATSLRMVTQPAGATSNVFFTTQPAVEILDQNGTRLTTATNAVTVSVGSGSGALSGTVTVSAVAGVATFTDLAITGTGANTLAFAAAGLTGVNAASLTVTAPTGFRLLVGANPSQTVTNNVNVVIPLNLEVPTGSNLASITMTVTWDPNKFTYVENTAGTWSDGSPTVNATGAASGSIQVALMASMGTTTSVTLRNLTLKPVNATGSAITGAVTATVSVAGTELGDLITVTPRNLQAKINP